MLNFNIPVKQLKLNGYTFQKLYANNYKCYYKKIGYQKLWLWVSKKEIELNNCFNHTDKVIEWLKNNQEHPDFIKIGWNNKPQGYIVIYLNREKGEIKQFTYKEKNELINTNNFYSYTELLFTKEEIKDILNEIDILTKTNYENK